MMASIHSGSSTKVWPEILAASKRYQCQIFAFPGGRLGSADEYEYMRNGIFSLVGSKSFDGAVCWSSSLSGFASEAQVESFLRDQVDIPLVTFGLKIGDKPVVNIDTYSGMKLLVFHLARKHHRSRIAFIGGPKAHSSAEDRRRAYRDALAESGITYDARIVSLDNPWHEGGKAIIELLDSRGCVPGRDFDALCAASDLLLFEAAKILKERGYRIPADLSCAGFNDSDESNLLSPTYTTVRMPFERQAGQAFHMLVEILEGKKPQDKLLKTSLVVRQSCGCLPESIRLARGFRPPWLKAAAAIRGEERTRKILAAAARRLSLGSGDCLERIGPVIASFASALAGSPEEEFLAVLDRAMDDFIAEEKDLSAFQDLLSILRAAYACSGTSPAALELLDSLVGQGRVLVSRAEKRMSNYRMWKERSQDSWLNILNHELLCAKDFGSIVNASGRYLPKLGIKSGYFVLDEVQKGRHSFLGFFESAPDGAETRIHAPQDGRAGFSSDLILPEEFQPKGQGAFVVLPLHYESTFLGYVCLGITGGGAPVFEEIRVLLSSAMRGILLFEQVNQARLRAEKAEKMKTEFLAGISGELQEPIRFINGMASRLLAEPDISHRKEIEAIAAHSADQLELTRRLFDLSLAQVGNLSMDFALFDPWAFASSFAESAAVKAGQRRWGPVRTDVPSRELPILWGDERRLSQVLEIFLDLLSRQLRLEAVDLSLRIVPGGLVFRLGGEGGTAEKAARLKRIVETRSGLASSNEARINVELARRIAFLHGGSLNFQDEAREGAAGLAFLLLLPYPLMDGTIPMDRQERNPQIMACLGPTVPEFLGSMFPDTAPVKLGVEELGGTKFSPEALSLVYIAPATFAPEDWAAVALLLEHPAFRKFPCFVPSPRLGSSQELRGATLGEYLGGLMPEESRRSVFLLGIPEESQEEFKILSNLIGEDGWRIFRCETPVELAILADREKPRLLILAGQRGDFLMAAAGKTSLSDIPLLCVAGKFDNPSFEAALEERPRTLIYNSGRVFAGIAASKALAILDGENILPAPTGVLVSKAIFFLNNQYREPVSRWRLSEQVNASEDYLSRIFHRQMGIPLWNYLNRLRIGRALELLRSSADSVAEIASRAGFQDQAYFCRVFKKVMGFTPGVFRKCEEANVRKVQ